MRQDVVEFTGHPQPLRSRAVSWIPPGSLMTLSEEEVQRHLTEALSRAHTPHGNDMVALVRADQQIVISWGEWNCLAALLFACKYELANPHGPEIPAADASALHQLLTETLRRPTTAKEFLSPDLPATLPAFLEGGAFRLQDIG